MVTIKCKKVAMEVSKREQMTEKCCEHMQQSLALDEIYRMSKIEEGKRYLEQMGE